MIETPVLSCSTEKEDLLSRSLSSFINLVSFGFTCNRTVK